MPVHFEETNARLDALKNAIKQALRSHPHDPEIQVLYSELAQVKINTAIQTELDNLFNTYQERLISWERAQQAISAKQDQAPQTFTLPEDESKGSPDVAKDFQQQDAMTVEEKHILATMMALLDDVATHINNLDSLVETGKALHKQYLNIGETSHPEQAEEKALLTKAIVTLQHEHTSVRTQAQRQYDLFTQQQALLPKNIYQSVFNTALNERSSMIAMKLQLLLALSHPFLTLQKQSLEAEATPSLRS